MRKDKTFMKYGRRRFLKLAGAGAIGMLTGGSSVRPFPFLLGSKNAVAKDRPFEPDLDITLRAIPDTVSLFPGPPTYVWRFRATVNKGNQKRVSNLPRTYLGPTIHARRGEKVRIRFINDLPEETIVHWHGLHVPASMDGHPRYVISHGETYLYEFEVHNRAGTYWYHPHPHGRTGPQVYGGLAGLFLVSDKEEHAVGLPDGEFDISMVIQDRTFDEDNQLVYLPGHHMAQMVGFLGDTVMVNGQPDVTLSLKRAAYRLRILNGSNARIYKIAWQDGRPLTIIGTDGGLLEKGVDQPHLLLAPGERIELWADFNDRPVGFETTLVSLPFDAGGMGSGNRRGMMMGGGRGGSSLPIGSKYTLFKVKVIQPSKIKRSLPSKLTRIPSLDAEMPAQNAPIRKFRLSMGHMQWTINGRVFQMDGVADDEIVQLGTKEIWEFVNTGGGMMPMMDMPHPIHLHGKSFRVLERNGVRHDSYMDKGWKDTVLLMPGERIRLLVDFQDYPGLFLYHCHNLEHEDMGMMRNYYVRNSV